MRMLFATRKNMDTLPVQSVNVRAANKVLLEGGPKCSLRETPMHGNEEKRRLKYPAAAIGNSVLTSADVSDVF